MICLLASLSNLIHDDVFQYFDRVDGFTDLFKLAPYGLTSSRHLWFWPFLAGFFIIQSVSESLLAYWTTTYVYMWVYKIGIPVLGLFLHQWFVPDVGYIGLGLVGLHQLVGVGLMMFIFNIHYWNYQHEWRERLFFSNLQTVLVSL